MDLTIIQQGRFTSDGSDKVLQIRSDVDWMTVYNYTQASAQNDVGVQYYWQRGMTQGTGLRYFKSGGANALSLLNLAAPNGFYLIDTSIQQFGTAATITNISNANPPRVTANGHGLVTGDIVRISSATGAAQLGGIDFYVTRVDANNVDLAYMAAIAPAANPGANARIRKIFYDPIYYPRRRFITKISQAAQAIVTFSVPHGYTVGQQVRFHIPRVTAIAYGMTELDGLTGNIVAIGQADADGVTNTITVDIDTSAFTAFAFPLTENAPFTPAHVVPLGEDTATALSLNADILDDATVNQAYIGMRLVGGANSPAGANDDVIYWVAGKSFSITNE